MVSLWMILDLHNTPVFTTPDCWQMTKPLGIASSYQVKCLDYLCDASTTLLNHFDRCINYSIVNLEKCIWSSRSIHKSVSRHLRHSFHPFYIRVSPWPAKVPSEVFGRGNPFYAQKITVHDLDSGSESVAGF